MLDRTPLRRRTRGSSGRRWRSALAGAVALVAVAPAVLTWTASSAETPALSCGSADDKLPWQGTPVPAFPAVDGVTTQDRIANYAVQPDRARNQVVTNGVTVQASETNGCTWGRSFSLAATPGPGGITATTARITAAALLPGGRGLLALREGSGAASRPRVLGATSGTGTTWATSEAGLPGQGAPGLLVPAADGDTVYLSVNPTGEGGDDGGGGIVLPPVGGGTDLPVPGLLYASTDGGRTWASRTAAAELPSRITALAVDRADADLVYAIAGGTLYRSTDGGRAFTATDVTGARTVVTMGSRQVAVFGAASAFYSSDAFATSAPVKAPSGVTSAAYRGDARLAIESNGLLYLFEPATGVIRTVRSATTARAGSLTGDVSRQATFHAIAGHALIRYVDPQPPADPADPPSLVDGVPPPAPPRPGVLTPASLDLKLKVGASRKVDYQLVLPKNPTPLDVMYVLDASPTMEQLISDLKAGVQKISRELVEQQVDVQTGVSVVTHGPVKGDLPYPEVDPLGNCPYGGYVKPEVFKRLRPVGPPDSEFVGAVRGIGLRCVPSQASRGHRTPFNPPEGQVLALDQLRDPDGVDLVQSQGSLLIPAGQGAGWRQSRFNRKVILLATDEPFISNVRSGEPGSGDWVAGSPEAAGRLDVDGTALRLKEDGVLVVGIDPGGQQEAANDLRRVATLTGALAPTGGVRCGSTGRRIPAGQPIVCNQSDDYTDAVLAVLRGLVDSQDVGIRTTTGSAAVSAVSAAQLRGVNVAQDNALRFSVTYSCPDAKGGKYLTTLETRLRGAKVGVTRTSLTCVKAAAPVVKPLPEAAEVQQVAPQPAQPAVPAPAPPAPAAQPQVQPQVQVQVQVNPMTAAMLEQQEQLQLALALNSLERPSDGTEMAMVDRRSREETGAQLLLLASMAAASVAGVRRLRTRPDPAVRRAR